MIGKPSASTEVEVVDLRKSTDTPQKSKCWSTQVLGPRQRYVSAQKTVLRICNGFNADPYPAL